LDVGVIAIAFSLTKKDTESDLGNGRDHIEDIGQIPHFKAAPRRKESESPSPARIQCLGI
jgi:hypothetical protein